MIGVFCSQIDSTTVRSHVIAFDLEHKTEVIDSDRSIDIDCTTLCGWNRRNLFSFKAISFTWWPVVTSGLTCLVLPSLCESRLVHRESLYALDKYFVDRMNRHLSSDPARFPTPTPFFLHSKRKQIRATFERQTRRQCSNLALCPNRFAFNSDIDSRASSALFGSWSVHTRPFSPLPHYPSVHLVRASVRFRCLATFCFRCRANQP